MRISPGAPAFFSHFIKPPRPQYFFRPFNLPLIFRPFIQPFISHPWLRPFLHPTLRQPPQPQQPTSRTARVSLQNPDSSSPRNWEGKDMTQRQDDPYIAKANRQSYDRQQAIEQLTRGIPTWQDTNQNNKTEIAYSFKQGGFNDQQKQDARQALTAWSDLANLEFTEDGGAAEGRVTFGISSLAQPASGTYPTPHGRGGGTTLYNPASVTRELMIHETGHALGLQHPGNYNGSLDENKRVYAQDSTAHTVMSYFNAGYSGKQLGAKPLAPMMDDIAAIQKKYGANHQTRKEDNTYGFNSNTQRDYYTLNSAQDRFIACIWDGAGNDTLDVSGYQSNQNINLRAGSFSDVGGLEGNVSIARDCIIENAIGGHGHDTLIGNDADNRLTGGAGGDQLRGDGGADTFVYNNASDSTPEHPDTLMDFTSGTDRIDVSGAMKNANTATLMLAQAFSRKAGETVLVYDEKTGHGSVSIDLTGDGRADLLINTRGQVKPEDIVQLKTAPLPASKSKRKRKQRLRRRRG